MPEGGRELASLKRGYGTLRTFHIFVVKGRSGRTEGKGTILSGVSNCLRRQYEELPALTLGESLLHS